MAKLDQERWTNEAARRVLDECERSGLSVEAFARQRGLRASDRPPDRPPLLA